MKLSLLSRELDRTARDPRVYWLRSAIPAAALVSLASLGLALLFMTIWAAMNNADAPSMNASGAIQRGLYLTIILQFAFVILGVPWVLSGTFSSERRDGTLDLLVLADFSGWDLIAAKAAGALAPSLAIIASAVPLQMSAVMFGAINPAAIAWYWCCIFALVVYQSGIGLWASLCSYSPGAAFLKAIAIGMIWPLVFIVVLYFARFYFNVLPIDEDMFFIALAVMGVVYILRTARRLSNVAEATDDALAANAPVTSRYEQFDEVPPGKALLALVAGYPMAAEAGQRHVAIAILLMLLQVVPVIGWVIALVVVAYAAMMFVRDARRDGVLVDVALIPCSGRIGKLLSRATQNWVLIATPAAVGSIVAFGFLLTASVGEIRYVAQIYPMEIPILLAIAVPFAHIYAARQIGVYIATRPMELGQQLFRVALLITVLYIVAAAPVMVMMLFLAALDWNVFQLDFEISRMRGLAYGTLLGYGPWNVIVFVFAGAWLRRLVTDDALLHGASGSGPPMPMDDSDHPPVIDDVRQMPTMERAAWPSYSHSTR